MTRLCGRRVLVMLVCAALGAGCGKKSGGGGGKLVFEAVAVELKYETRDYRKMAYRILAQVPTDWEMLTEGESKNQMNTFAPVAAKGEKPSIFTSSSLTLSTTCHGTCRAENMDEQIKGVAKSRASRGKILQDGELRPGVWAFVLEIDGLGKRDQSYDVGVTFRGAADEDSVVFCEALLMGKHARHWQAVLDACAATKIETVNLVVGEAGAAAEEIKVRKCPATTTLTHTPKEPKPEDPAFTGPLTVRATSSRTGEVTVKIGNFAPAGDDFPEAVTPGQGVLRLGLLYENADHEVLSGSFPLTGGGGEKGWTEFGLLVAPATTLQLSSGEGGVEVIARTPKKICGSIDIKDNWRTVKGEFVADIVSGR